MSNNIELCCSKSVHALALISKLRNTCHASLSVFSSELDFPDESHEMLSNLRHKDYGEVEVTAIEIVSYKRTLDAIDVHSLAKIDVL